MRDQDLEQWSLALFLLLALMLYAFLDAGCALCFTGPALMLYAAAFGLIASPFLFRMRRRTGAAICLVFLVALMAVWAVPWNTRKPFLRALRSIAPGMTVAEVEARMAACSIDHSPVMSPEFSGTVGYRHSDSGHFNADIGEVTFAQGRVLAVRFLPD